MDSIPLSGDDPRAPREPTGEGLRDLLVDLDANERSGIVVAKTSDGDMTRIHLRRGTIVSVEQPTSATSWVLAEYLLRTQSLSSSRLLRARKRAEKNDVALEEVLVDRKMVSADLLKRLVDLQAEEALMPLFRASGLTVFFVEERPIPALYGSQLPVSYVLKEGERQRSRWGAIRRRVGRPDAIYRHEGPFAVSALGYETEDETDEPLPELSGDARLVYFFVNGERTTEQIARCCALSLFQTMAAMEELLDACVVSLVTTHGKGEEIREASAFLPRLVWLVTTVAILGMVSVFYDGVRDVTLPQQGQMIPAELRQAASASHLRDVNDGVRLYQLIHGQFPSSLEGLEEAGLRHPTRIIESVPLTYLGADEGFRLRLEAEAP